MKTGTLRLTRTTQKPLPAFPLGAPDLVQQSFAASGEVYCSRKTEGIGSLNALYSSRSRMSNSQKAAIAQYLSTGEHDPLFSDWPGAHLAARGRQGAFELRDALVSSVISRTPYATARQELRGMDLAPFARKKLEPMVRGLFSRREQQAVLDVLAHSVVFLTPAIIEDVLNQSRYLKTAWILSNIYLASCGSERLSDDAPDLVGLSEDTTCYVSMDYFKPNGQFDDFVVHEAAHILHNCKRRTIGLPEIGGRERLLDIEFGKRETFAYACEGYSRIRELGRSVAAYRELFLKLENGPTPPDDRVIAREYLDVLSLAVAARNGWKQILQNCQPSDGRHASLKIRPG